MRRYWRPLLVVLASLPLVVFVTEQSLAWLGNPFPGFFVLENRVVPTVSTYAWPRDRGEIFHARVVAIDGTPVESAREVYARAIKAHRGTIQAESTPGQGTTMTVRLPARAPLPV